METESKPTTIDGINLKEFILHFEKLPELWDASRSDYMNKAMRHRGYEKLLTIYNKIKPNATIDDVRKKINSLRSNFRKELKKVEESKVLEESPVYKPKSWVFHALHFLNDVIRTNTSLQIPKPEKYLQDENESSPKTAKPPDAPEPDVKRQKINSIEERYGKTYPASTKRVVGTKPQSNNNATALYWAEKLEKLNNIQRMYAEKAINDILFEAQMGTLSRNSVQINVSSTSSLESDEFTTVYVPITSPTDSYDSNVDINDYPKSRTTSSTPPLHIESLE